MKRTPAPKGSTVARLLSHVEAIGLEPGARLPSERELAPLLGASRSSVREALAVLDSMRVVEVRSNSGIYLRKRATDYSFDALVLQSNSGVAVAPLEIRQSMEVRLALEVTAVELACRRRTAADLAALRRILAETEVQIASGNSIEEEDQAFHLALVAATRNDIYARVLNSFYWLSKPRRRVYFSDPANRRRSQREHIALVDAVAARDAKRACLLITKHMRSAAVYWRSALTRRAG
jgi:GntR family transcriptional repressor for pyruvate dehydrogenase complex